MGYSFTALKIYVVFLYEIKKNCLHTIFTKTVYLHNGIWVVEDLL